MFNGEGVSVLQEVLEMGLHNNVNVLNTTERVHLKKGYDGNSSLMWISAQLWASLVAQSVKCLPAVREIRIQSLGRDDPLEKEMATHSSTLACKIPRTGGPGRL